MTVKIVKKITRKQNPYRNPKVESSHRKANDAEKKRYPTGYKTMKKVDAKLGRHEFAGKHNAKGKVEISKKVPKRLRKEVEYHERVEYKQERKRGYYK